MDITPELIISIVIFAITSGTTEIKNFIINRKVN